jgi:hypothetical protein
MEGKMQAGIRGGVVEANTGGSVGAFDGSDGVGSRRWDFGVTGELSAAASRGAGAVGEGNGWRFPRRWR